VPEALLQRVQMKNIEQEVKHIDFAEELGSQSYTVMT
jgi:hypothetical protein